MDNKNYNILDSEYDLIHIISKGGGIFAVYDNSDIAFVKYINAAKIGLSPAVTTTPVSGKKPTPGFTQSGHASHHSFIISKSSG